MPTYAKNKKALHDYELLETLEAGLILKGHEVKSIRTGQVKLTGSYVTFHKGKPIITNLHIPLYKYATIEGSYDPEQPRKLLLNKKEIAYLYGKSMEKGLTIIPISLYTKGRRIKIELAIARGKKKYDKRAKLKKRELERETARAMKSKT